MIGWRGPFALSLPARKMSLAMHPRAKLLAVSTAAVGIAVMVAAVVGKD